MQGNLEISGGSAVGSGPGDAAPNDAEYIVAAADADLTAERVATDTTSVTWDFDTAGQAKAIRAALTGDVTAAADANATTIANNAVTDAKLRDSAAVSVIGRSANTSGDPADIAAAANNQFLRRRSDVVGFGSILASDVPAPGSDTQVIFNDGGALGGDAGLTYVKATDTLTVAGGLVVDTDTLFVDPTNNRVGIGTTGPGAPLDVIADGSALGVRIRGRSLDGIGVLQFMNNTASAESARLQVDDDGTFTIHNTGTLDERLQIDSSGHVGIAGQIRRLADDLILLSHSASDLGLHVPGTGGNILLRNAANSSSLVTVTDAGTATIAGQVNAPKFVDSNDATYYLDPADGTLALNVAGTIRGPNAGAATPTFASKDDANTGIYFDGADALLFATAGSERMRITSGGVLNLTSGQLKFPASQNASTDPNTLDDYEEGTFTPGVSFGGGTTDITYASQSAIYVKIGKFVYISGFMQLSAKGSSTGDARLTELPFTNGDGTFRNVGIQLRSGMASITGASIGEVEGSASTVLLVQQAATGTVSLTEANFTDSSVVAVNGWYRTVN